MGEGRQKRHTELLNYNQMLTTGTGNISISQTQFSGEKTLVLEFQHYGHIYSYRFVDSVSIKK